MAPHGLWYTTADKPHFYDKPHSQEKLDRCNAKLYDLSHSFNNIKVSDADFKMFKESNLAYKLLKSNPNIVILKADKGTSFVILNTEFVRKNFQI